MPWIMFLVLQEGQLLLAVPHFLEVHTLPWEAQHLNGQNVNAPGDAYAGCSGAYTYVNIR